MLHINRISIFKFLYIHKVPYLCIVKTRNVVFVQNMGEIAFLTQ